ncbi:MAG TPA: FAD-containing oxidoreductase [Gemmatimonadota bacterium]|nr:FAD-containing oxidoreductase [Gemmatimonadota bacterium]
MRESQPGEQPREKPGAAHDHIRESLVRPAGWGNPPPAGRYDLVVLGAGTAGLVAAAGAAGLGARVAVVERGLMGGDCLNHGCVPSKALLASARRAAEARRAASYGVLVERVGIDFAAIMERMRRIRAGLAEHDSAARFRDLGVDVFLGEGQFDGRDAVEVEGARLPFRHGLVATGGAPLVPSVPGLLEGGFLTNETIFDLQALPRRLAVVGAGPVGCELAQAFARFGAAVTLVEAQGRILPSDEPDAAAVLADALTGEGIRILTGHQLERVEGGVPPGSLFVRGPEGLVRVEADAILVATGRRPTVDGIGLDRAGIEHDLERGIRVDDRLRTTNRSVYAAGDVAGRHRFTHMADAEARIVLRNAFFPGRRKASALHVPWCTFTDPEVGRVGHSAASAAEAGIAVDSFTLPLSRVDRFVLEGEEMGFARVHVRRGSDEVVGATVVGAHAGELIGVVALTMRAGAGLAALADTVFPYPTRSEALRKVAGEWQRSRLTPRIRRLLEGWFRWRR